MYIESVPNRNSPPAILLRESYREEGKVRKRTLCNLSEAPAQRSEAAVRKQTTGFTPDGLPVHSFRTLLADLATLTRNTVVTAIAPALPLTVLARPTPVQRRACELLELPV